MRPNCWVGLKRLDVWLDYFFFVFEVFTRLHCCEFAHGASTRVTSAFIWWLNFMFTRLHEVEPEITESCFFFLFTLWWWRPVVTPDTTVIWIPRHILMNFSSFILLVILAPFTAATCFFYKSINRYVLLISPFISLASFSLLVKRY